MDSTGALLHGTVPGTRVPSGHRDAPCEDIDALVRARLTEVEDRIVRLNSLRADLEGMLCHQQGTVADCRVVEVLSDHDHCAHDH